MKRILIASALALVGVGCASPPRDEIGVVAENLAYYAQPGQVTCTNPSAATVTYWNINETIDLCFTGPAGATFQQQIRDTIVQNWGAAIGLSLRWNGTCPATIPSTWMSIHAKELTEVNFWGTGAPGKGNRLKPSCPEGTGDRADGWDKRSDVQIQITGKLNEPTTRWNILHEFGHALGFYHEHDRHDYPDIATCLDGAGNPVSGNATAGWITDWDAMSIMSYCGVAWGRPADAWWLTPLDALGAEMMHPKSTSGHRIDCEGKGCIRSAGGGAIVRDNGTITSAWKARGAPDVPMLWQTASSQLRFTEFADADELPAGSSTFAFSFQDAQYRSLYGSAPVVRSNAEHTAVILAAL